MRTRVFVSALSVLVALLLVAAPVCLAESGDYIVQAGDTLGDIAQEMLGDTSRYGEIVEGTNARASSDSSYTRIEDPNLIEVGWKLAIPIRTSPHTMEGDYSNVVENKALVESLIVAFNEGTLDLIDEIVADDFVLHHSLLPADLVGPEALKAFFGASLASFPDMRHPYWSLIGDGDLVVAHMPLLGTFEKEFNGIPPTGEQINVLMANVWRVEDGKLVEAWFNMDTLGFMQQMGVVPPLG